MYSAQRNMPPLKRVRLNAARLLCALALVLGSVVHAEPAPDLFPFEVSYDASVEKGISLNGSAKRILTAQGNNVWLYRTEVKSFIADLDESLIFSWKDGQVVPLRYRYHLSGLLIKDRKQSIDFNWETDVATGKYRGKPFTIELSKGILDPLGFQVQLHQDILNGKRDMEYEVLDRGKVDTQRYAVISDNADVSDNSGSNDNSDNNDSSQPTLLKAEKIRENSRRETYMWFDPDKDYVLVRLQQIEPDGSAYELKLKDVKLGD
ncbi:hypothetical protein LCGC14_0999020 [marine sediment metagenome]|nr:DUF3108 domain-containing protein [Marinobacter antarcticus]